MWDLTPRKNLQFSPSDLVTIERANIVVEWSILNEYFESLGYTVSGHRIEVRGSQSFLGIDWTDPDKLKSVSLSGEFSSHILYNSAIGSGHYMVTLWSSLVDDSGQEAVNLAQERFFIPSDYKAQVININSVTNRLGDPLFTTASPVTVALPSGRYALSYLSPETGGAYYSWKTCCNQGWTPAFSMAIGAASDVVISGWDRPKFPTPEAAFDSVKNSHIEFTVDGGIFNTGVHFGVADDPYNDNSGGISLLLERVGDLE